MNAQKNTLSILKEMRLTEKDIKIYLFLVDQSPQKASTIAKSLRMHKMQVYRCLMEMEKKGVVEVTFEAPKRFTAIPFQRIYDENTKKLQIRLNLLKSEREEVLDYWEKFKPINNLYPIETFSIIEGREKISSTILSFGKNAKKELCVVLPLKPIILHNIEGLHQGIEKIKYKYRCITRITEDISPMEKQILKKLCNYKNVEMRQIDANLEPFPGFAVRDGMEFIMTLNVNETFSNISVLRSNNKMFTTLLKKYFEDLWKNAINLSDLLG